MRIEDYAVIGDTQTVALVGRHGSIDWLCFPRFDSPACFASLLGRPDHGRWLITPHAHVQRCHRRYRDDTLVLESEMETEDGTIRLIDLMPIRDRAPDIVRIVEGVSGRVLVDVELVIRYDYGDVLPWVRNREGRLHAIAGPDGLVLATPIELHGKGLTTVGQFAVEPGDRVPFTLTWHSSYTKLPESPDPFASLADTEVWWREWAGPCKAHGRYRDPVVRSLITLKALTYAPTGGIVAAGTTSLPETLGGVRNWDYRYCWLRDATFTLQALLQAGYRDEASAWRDWLLRAVAGDPARLQIMYGVAGERRLDERELPWLPGYEGSRPVRVGNGAASQLQLDVYGELVDMLFQARSNGLGPAEDAWSMVQVFLDWLESHWHEPDEGMWEIRAPRQQFTFSKVMVWVAFDRAIKTIERFGGDGPIDRWRTLRDGVHADICRRAFDRRRNTFTQAYGSKYLDASLLQIPAVGFLPPRDPRVVGTIEAIEHELMKDGFLERYPTSTGENLDGLPGRDNAFIACSFWLVDALVLAGRRDDAQALFERLLAIRNDVGLLSEEYDTRNKRLVGNIPQAFSHVALVNSAHNLSEETGPAKRRAG